MLNRITLASVLLCLTTVVSADDWPQWRGVNRDAKLSPAEQVATLPTRIVKRKWSVELGAGYSGPTVADGRVYVTDRGPDSVDKEIERILCFDADTGKEIWKHQYDACLLYTSDAADE